MGKSREVTRFARVLGRDVRVGKIQLAVNDLMDANLILRRGHGLYDLSVPYGDLA